MGLKKYKFENGKRSEEEKRDLIRPLQLSPHLCLRPEQSFSNPGPGFGVIYRHAASLHAYDFSPLLTESEADTHRETSWRPHKLRNLYSGGLGGYLEWGSLDFYLIFLCYICQCFPILSLQQFDD